MTNMSSRTWRLFNTGESLLEYGASLEYPFDGSSARHWRANARRVLHLAHCLWVLEQSDEEVFDEVIRVLEVKDEDHVS